MQNAIMSQVVTARKLLAVRAEPHVGYIASFAIPCRGRPLLHPIYFLGLGIFSYAFGLGARFGFLFGLLLPSPAPWSCSQLS